MRALYSLLLYLLVPGVLLRLWLKGRREPGYRRHWRERFALQPPPVRGALWLHAVSVGEVRALAPLLTALQSRYPQRPLLLTVTTVGGRHTARELYGERLACCYLPYDLPGAVRRFVTALDPVKAVFAELELWPNLFAELAARRVPLYLVNARLSERSLRRYRYTGGLIPATLRRIRHIAAQSQADAARFRRLGARAQQISVTGNLKLAASLPANMQAQTQRLRQRLSGRQPVWVAGSTHAGEEAVMLDAHREVLQRYPRALLLLVPRHPERAPGLARECAAAQLACRLLSDAADAAADVLIVDRLGLLVYCYAVADVAVVAGSFVPRGGHNPVEALLAGAPVLSGPRLENFADLYAQLQAAGAARVAGNSEELAAQLLDWFGEPPARQLAAQAGKQVIGRYRDPVDRLLALIDPQAA